LARKKREVDPWEKWMGELKHPINPNELLDKGLAKVIKVMNIPGKMFTSGSCLHDKLIILEVEDKGWFLNIMLPCILRLNDKSYGISGEKQYDGRSPIPKM